MNRVKPDEIHHSQLLFSVSGKEDWDKLKVELSEIFENLNEIIHKDKTLLLTIPPYKISTQNFKLSTVIHTKYIQTPKKICSICFDVVDDIAQHKLSFHSKTDIFCKHTSHGNEIFYFQTQEEKKWHDCVHHFLDGRTKTSCFHASDTFPKFQQKCTEIGVDPKELKHFFKRKVSHLSLPYLPNKKYKFSTNE